MQIDLLSFIIMIVVALGLLFFVIWGQVKLSQHESKYLGLILPALFFIFALTATLGLIPFDFTGKEKIAIPLAAFFIWNIPTVVLLLIYKSVRSRSDVNRSIDRSKFKDL